MSGKGGIGGGAYDKGVKAKLIHTGEIKRIAGLLSGSCQIPGPSSLIECITLESCLLLGEDREGTGMRQEEKELKKHNLS